MGQIDSKDNDKDIIDSAIKGEFSVRPSADVRPPTEKQNYSETEESTVQAKESKALLSFTSYTEYLNEIEDFENLLENELPSNIVIKPPLELELENCEFVNIDSCVDKDRLFCTAMSIYHQVRDIYGNTQNYPKKELEKINFTLISKYLSYNYDVDEEIPRVTEKVIKRLNFFSEEFPLRLYHMTSIFKQNLGYIFGYDKFYNLNFYIDYQGINIQCHIPYLAYFIYIVFIMEHVLPILRKNKKKFSEKINILINFNGDAPNTELITFLNSYMNNYYPLSLNRMHIVNFDIEMLKKEMSFIDTLKKNDFFRAVVFHYNKGYTNILSREIRLDFLPKSFGGTAEVAPFKLEKKKDTMGSFIVFLLKNIFIDTYQT